MKSLLHTSPFRLAVAALCCAVLSAPTFAQTHTVVLREVPLTLPAEAVIEATKQAVVATQVSGRIVAVSVEAGQRVKAGQVLMRIDAREATENAAAARAQLVQAEANYTRTQNLFKQKFISQAALDAADAALKSARAQAGAAGAGASHATVTSPLSGLVAERHAELGDLAMPGKPLLTVFDPQGLRAVANIPQYKLQAAQQAKRARVEFPGSRRWLDGVRVEILPTIDAQSHTATARVTLADADLDGVVPGMAARVHFVVGSAQKLTVPPQAILRRGEISAVYVLKEGKSILRQVRLGEPVADGEIEVLSGLSTGETISLDPVKTGIELKQTK
ncbi:MAG: efflux RND transporter periplasmic adaptor subunit [Rhodocyclaceae bacterium]|nr:efflux RND transporter periplasmic adaptor subunit [Rhodocyclaceae bacterium]MDZ4213535.1 efflux RND transporter periplasmic adaptor subunit [Rhodocyclaceae bacterium]